MGNYNVFQNAGLAISGAVGAAVFAMAANMVVARNYEMDESGAFFASNAITIIAGFAAVLGTKDLIIRESPYHDSLKNSIPKLTVLRVLVASVLASAVSALCIYFISNSGWMMFLATAPLLFAPIQLSLAVWRLQERFLFVFLALMCVSLTKLVLAILALMAGYSIETLSVLIGIVFAGTCLAVWYHVFKIAKDGNNHVLNTKSGMPYFISNLVGGARSQLDLILIDIFLGSQAASLYVPSSALPKRARVFVVSVVDTTLLHRTLKIAKQSLVLFKIKVLKLTGLWVALGLIVAYFCSLFADQFLSLYGEKYLEAKPFFLWLLILIPIRFGLAQLTSALKHRHSAAGRTFDQIITLALMCLLITLLAPTYGLAGGIAAVVCADTTLAVFFIIRLMRMKPIAATSK